MTKILRDLDWPSLEDRRSVARLTLFYKIFNKHVDIALPQSDLSKNVIPEAQI